jgi:hypothetical protein
MENRELVNPYEYSYEQDQLISINANAVTVIMQFLQQVIEKEPSVGALRVYPKKVDEIKDEDGNLLKVTIDWAEHTANSFFFTAAEENGAVPITTEISLKANQLLFALTQIHQDNINKGIAKKSEEVNGEGVFKS